MRKRLISTGKLGIALGLGILFLMAGKTDVQASSIMDDVAVQAPNKERSLLNDVDSVSDTSYQKTRSLHLYFGYAQITKLDYDRVAIIGTTQCHHACPEVYLSIAIDQYDPETGLWNQLRNWDYDETDAECLTRELELYVPTGYYYSVRGYHSAVHDDTVETTTTTTDGLYVGITDEPIKD